MQFARMFKQWLMAMMLALIPVAAQEIPVPERPADFIQDQTGKLTPEELSAWRGEMQDVVSKSGLALYSVLLNAPPEEPPLDLARRLVQSWTGAADRAVLVAGPGMNPPVVMAVAGESLAALAPAQLEELSSRALAAATGAGSGGWPMVQGYARSIASQVADFRAGKALQPPPAPGEAPQPAAAPVNYTMAAAAGGALLCCLLALLLMKKSRRSALIFPAVPFRRRFSAPHSGGNDAMVRFDRE